MPLATQQSTGKSVNTVETVHQLVNVSKEAEMSISPVLVVPVVTDDGQYYKVKTLLDSGSTTNWITKKVLDKVKHTIKGNKKLSVFTFNGQVIQSFPLAEISVHDEQGKVKNIICYVMDRYTDYVTVEGICPYIQFNHTTPYQLSKPLVDPSSTEVDHTDAPNSIGMIFCSSTINILRTKEPVTLLPELKILLEPTIFGTVISGSVPKCLKSQNHLASQFNVAVTPISETSDLHSSTMDIVPKDQLLVDKRRRSFKRSVSTSYITFYKVLYCLVLLLNLAAVPYSLTSPDCKNLGIQQALQANVYTDPAQSYMVQYNSMDFFKAPLNLPSKFRMVYEKGKSVSLAQDKMSRIVLKHFGRHIIHFHFPTCIQVKNKVLKILSEFHIKYPLK